MKILFSSFLLMISTLAIAQEAPLRVTVTDFAFIALEGEQVLFINQASKKEVKGVSNDKGIFVVNLPAGKYDIKIKSVGDAEDFSTFEVPPLPAGQTYAGADMQIQISQPEFFTLDNLHFASGKWDILKSSYAELNELLDYLKLKKNISIEIGGHTDSDGEELDNQSLSQKRADAVKTYLIGKGIAAKRIKAVGYGELNPVADNTSTTGKAKNRRTEVRIL